MLKYESMKEKFLSYGIELTEEQNYKFERYYEFLIEENSKFNITAITDREEVILKHFIDSALGLKLISEKNNLTLVDIGSGGGFPAIPIKIMRPDIKMTLIESTGKKCNFLKNLCKLLKLNDVEIICDRAENLAKELKYREKFDYCTARAFAYLPTLTEYCLPFVKLNGRFLAYKSDAEEEIKASSNALNILGGRIEKIESFLLDGAARTLVLIEKIKKTDLKYPRGNGKERKNPL